MESQQHDVNVLGAQRATRAALPLLRKQGKAAPGLAAHLDARRRYAACPCSIRRCWPWMLAASCSTCLRCGYRDHDYGNAGAPPPQGDQSRFIWRSSSELPARRPMAKLGLCWHRRMRALKGLSFLNSADVETRQLARAIVVEAVGKAPVSRPCRSVARYDAGEGQHRSPTGCRRHVSQHHIWRPAQSSLGLTMSSLSGGRRGTWRWPAVVRASV